MCHCRALLFALLLALACATLPAAAPAAQAAVYPAAVYPAAQPAAPQAIPTQATYPTQGVVKSNANLRAGPGTNFAKAGSARAGQTVTITGTDAAGNWLQLDGGQWIAAFLVDVRPAAQATTVTAAPAAKPAPAKAVPAGAVPAQVVYIVDGDTIHVDLGGQEYSLRYILMNTPETDEPFGSEATAANRKLVEGKTVYLVKDVSETDRYGRLLRYVYLADGTFVNAELVRQGLAQLATFPPDVSKEPEIRQAQQQAMAAGRGLWGATAAQPTPAPVERTSGTVAVNPGAVNPGAGGAALAIVAVDKRDEFVDIRNNGASAADLSGWTLRSEKGSQDCALGGTLAPGATLRIFAMTGSGGYNCGFGSNIWNNSETDPAVLLAPDGSEVSRY